MGRTGSPADLLHGFRLESQQLRSPIATWWVLVSLVGTVIGLQGCAVDETEEQDSISDDEDLAALVALPYLSWTEEDVDPEQLGVTLWDGERAWSGLNLYTNDVNEAYLMDMEGRRLHTWSLSEDYNHCEYFELLAGGEIAVVCVS